MTGWRLVTARQVAEVLDVPIGTVRSWHERGLIVPVDRAPVRGRPHRYWLAEVLHAERRTRHGDPAHQRARKIADG